MLPFAGQSPNCLTYKRLLGPEQLNSSHFRQASDNRAAGAPTGQFTGSLAKLAKPGQETLT